MADVREPRAVVGAVLVPQHRQWMTQGEQLGQQQAQGLVKVV